MMLLVLVLAFFILIFIASGLMVLKEWERVVILRLGKYYGVRGPGIIWKTPILDKVALRVSLRNQSTDIDTGKYISSDGSFRRLKGIVQWRIVDIERYALSIDDHYRTVVTNIQHHVRKIVESMTSEEVYRNQDELNSKFEETLEPIFADWGLKIVDIDLRTAPEWE